MTLLRPVPELWSKLVRVAFVSIPRFPCVVEVWRQPALAGQPLIVGDAEQPKRVFDCSIEASAQHVRHGMTIRAALAECPDALVVSPDPVLYRNLWEGVIEALGGISPEVEDEELGRAYLNVAGLQSHYWDETTLAAEIAATVRRSSGLDASVGIAAGKFVAFAAATMLPPGEMRAVAAGAEAVFLAPQSVDLLPVESEVIFRLRLLGLDQI